MFCHNDIVDMCLKCEKGGLGRPGTHKWLRATDLI